MAELHHGATGTDEVLAVVDGCLGLVRLNRPRALNALTGAMVGALDAWLDAWADDDTVRTVALTGAGDRGLCSGADVRAWRETVLHPADPDDPWADVRRFLRDEYALDRRIADYPKPVVAIMDGVVMGGGLGLSMHADLRLVTPRSRVAMPETMIGFFPDVGAAYPLARAPGETGTHLVLTGATVTGADAIALGLADAMIEPDQIPAVLGRLIRGDQPDATIGARPPSPLVAQRSWIDACYTGDDPEAIRARLADHPDPEARAAAAAIAQGSPLSVAVALAAIRRARTMTHRDEAYAQDLHLGTVFTPRSDLLEGVRAQLVDRDHAPAWSRASLTDVDPGTVRSYFAGL